MASVTVGRAAMTGEKDAFLPSSCSGAPQSGQPGGPQWEMGPGLEAAHPTLLVLSNAHTERPLLHADTGNNYEAHACSRPPLPPAPARLPCEAALPDQPFGFTPFPLHYIARAHWTNHLAADVSQPPIG